MNNSSFVHAQWQATNQYHANGTVVTVGRAYIPLQQLRQATIILNWDGWEASSLKLTANGGLDVGGRRTTVQTVTSSGLAPFQQFQSTYPSISAPPITAIDDSTFQRAPTSYLNDETAATLQSFKGDLQYDTPLNGTSLTESSSQLPAAEANDALNFFLNGPSQLATSQILEDTNTTSKQIDNQYSQVTEPPEKRLRCEVLSSFDVEEIPKCSLANKVENEFFSRFLIQHLNNRPVKPVFRCLDKGLRKFYASNEYFQRYGSSLASQELDYTQCAYGIFIKISPGNSVLVALLFIQEYWESANQANNNRAFLSDCLFKFPEAVSDLKEFARKMVCQACAGYAAHIKSRGFETMHLECDTLERHQYSQIVENIGCATLSMRDWLFHNIYGDSVRGVISRIPYFEGSVVAKKLDECVKGRAEIANEERVRKPFRKSIKKMGNDLSVVRLNSVIEAKAIRLQSNKQSGCKCSECIDPLTRNSFEQICKKNGIIFGSTLEQCMTATTKLISYTLSSRPNQLISVEAFPREK